MAIIGKGIFGNVSGRIGDIQGSRWRGRDTLQGYNSKGNGVLTSKMLAQRSSFANCRNVLKKLRADLMNQAVGSGSSSLPAWPFWVGQVAKTFPSGNDWLGSSPVIIKSKNVFSPNPYQFISGVYGDQIQYIVDCHNTLPFSDRKRMFCVYLPELRDFVIYPSEYPSYIPFLVFDLPYIIASHKQIVVFTWYEEPSVRLSAWASSVFIFNSTY